MAGTLQGIRPHRRVVGVGRSPADTAAAFAGEPSIGLTPRLARWLMALVVIGVAARVIRYLLCFPLWDDEAFLCASLIDRDFAQLAEPLDFHQVAPIGFLWIQAALVRVLGFNELALRLFPLVCGLGSLALFCHLARRVLAGYAQVAAVGILAVAYPAIRYSCEAKPYGSDLAVSLALVMLAVEWWLRGRSARWLWALALVMPLAVAVSYPAVFTAGGISISIALALCFQHRESTHPSSSVRPSWAAWTVLNAALVGTFVAMYWLVVRQQHAAEIEPMSQWWNHAFPPLAEPWRWPLWLLERHTGSMLAYPLGSDRGGSTLTFIACVVGFAALWRGGRRGWALAALSPAALNLVAAALERYPYGGHLKFGQFIAPTICLFAGVGAAAIVAAVARHWPRLRAADSMLLAGLLLLGAGSFARDLWRPYKTLTDVRNRDFARWFWTSAEFQGEALCLKSDLGLSFAPAAWHDLYLSAMYLCNQRIYSPRHARGEPVRWDRISANRPLTCVEYCPGGPVYDEAARSRWLADMQSRYALVSEMKLAFPCFDKRERTLINLDHVLVYKFIPREAVAAGRLESRR